MTRIFNKTLFVAVVLAGASAVPAWCGTLVF